MMRTRHKTCLAPGVFGDTTVAIERVGPDAPDRHTLDAYVRRVFARRYGAMIPHLCSELLCVRDNTGSPTAVVGMRQAARERLYPEIYLNEPIEAAVSWRAGRAVDRSRIVEIAHLAPESAGQTRLLIGTLARHLHDRGFEWVVFTAVPRIRSAFCGLDLNPIELIVASAKRLPEAERPCWGRYYDQQPIVCIGEIRLALEKMEGTGSDS